MRDLSITSRMMLIALTPALLVTCLLSLYFVTNRVKSIEASEIQKAQTLAEGLALASEFALTSRNSELLTDVAKPALHIQSIADIRFLDSQGAVIIGENSIIQKHHSVGTLGRLIRPWISDLPLVSQVEKMVFRTDLSQYDDPYFVTADSMLEGKGKSKQVIGSVQLTVDLSAAYKQQLKTIRQALFMAALVLLLATPAAYRLARSVSQPVRELTGAVKQLAMNNYVRDIPVNVGGELGELSLGVSHLSDELQSFHARLSESTRIATVDLQNTLSVLERRNQELDDSRSAAEQASAFKSDFLANMSHEIRTPMNTIIGTLSVLELSALDAEQREQLDVVDQSAKHLLCLIDDILDIAKVESGNLRIELVETNLDDLLQEVFTTAAQQAVARAIELSISTIPFPELRHVVTDPLRLKQVLFNLISNAIKFTHKGHVLVDITARHIVGRDYEILFSVVDTGIGIPEEKQETLFSAFTQVDMSTTRHYGGTGLGLHISREIVTLMRGSISLSSVSGEGARFDVRLPLTSTSAQATPVSLPSRHVMRYVDNYLPLEEANRIALVNAGVLLFDGPLTELPESASVLFNIPNHLLNSAVLETATFALPSINNVCLALVSQISPGIRKWMQRVGFDGYVLRTPHIGLLRRSIEIALNHRSFLEINRESELEISNGSTDRCLNILAVDDQQINLDLLTRYFHYLEIDGVFTLSSDEAIEMLMTRRFDLVLLDLHMPVLDGFQLAEKIRKNRGINQKTPIVAMTADAFRSTRERAMRNGFNSVITKPMTIENIKKEIDKWLITTTIAEKSTGDENIGIKPEAIVSLHACAEAVLGDTAWARKALCTYGHEVSEHIAALLKALKQQDRNQLFHVAHAIKGVSDVCRITVVAEYAKSVETGSESANWEHLENLVNSLIESLEQAASECRALENSQNSSESTHWS
ncbi:MAG: ATP-binding protein [Granulosicoccus sp.]